MTAVPVEPPATAPPLVELRGIVKSFGPVAALQGVDLVLHGGEVLALLGENGAGKSTLMNVLDGLVAADAGSIHLRGRPVAIDSPAVARSFGIAMVHQHFSLAPDLTVAENFVLDEGGRRLFHLDRREADARVAERARALGFRLDARARVGDLAVGDQQRAEILKALKGEVQVLILDEPTATLTAGEVAELFAVVRRVRDQGRAVVLISHKLREVRALADRVVVLRQGRVVAEHRADAVSEGELAEAMVGERVLALGVETERAAAVPAPAPGPPRVELRGVTTRPRVRRGARLRDVDLAVRAGEIAGIAGVDGNGQGELAALLVGLLAAATGDVRIDGRVEARLTPSRAASLGIAHVPADRARLALLGDLTLEENLIARHYRMRRFGRGPFLARSAVRDFAVRRLGDLEVRPADPRGPARALSGGNQQRLVLGRELAFSPRVIVAENPTRGLDVRATDLVHRALREAARDGAAVVLISSDLDEVLRLAGALHVIHEGRLTAAGERDPRALGLLMSGAAGPPS